MGRSPNNVPSNGPHGEQDIVRWNRHKYTRQCRKQQGQRVHINPAMFWPNIMRGSSLSITAVLFSRVYLFISVSCLHDAGRRIKFARTKGLNSQIFFSEFLFLISVLLCSFFSQPMFSTDIWKALFEKEILSKSLLSNLKGEAPEVEM